MFGYKESLIVSVNPYNIIKTLRNQCVNTIEVKKKRDISDSPLLDENLKKSLHVSSF